MRFRRLSYQRLMLLWRCALCADLHIDGAERNERQRTMFDQSKDR